MSNTPARSLEAAPEVISAGAQTSDTGALQRQASGLLTSPEANDSQNAQQSKELLAQGLKDIGAKNEVYGILELMKGATQQPDLIQSTDFLNALKAAVGDVHTDPHTYPLDTQQLQAARGQVADAGNGNPQGQGSAASDAGAQSADKQPLPQPTDVSSQLVQQGLQAIAGGDKMAGIMALMQAAQLNPNILNDNRFVTALQTALSQSTKGPDSTASVTGKSKEASSEQMLADAPKAPAVTQSRG